tara:strand:- start:854 stop:1393 length:540 start_codon:yes stop_codon:yes gene_type:complete
MTTAITHALDNVDRGIGKYKSAFRSDADRKKHLVMDQAVGQVTTAAACKYLYGDIQHYVTTRFYRNQTPDDHDHGYDLGALNVDVKGSYMRGSDDPMKYSLYVSKKTKEWIYILVLIKGVDDPMKWSYKRPTIYVPGYALTNDFPDKILNGKWRGRYLLPATSLRKLPPFNYHYHAHKS